jgi:hypothetical protein
MEMITLRHRVADGSATPSEIAEFDQHATTRVAALEAAMEDAVNVVIGMGTQPILAGAMFSTLYDLALRLRERGHDPRALHEDNGLMVAGGLKGAVLPPDYREIVLGCFRVSASRLYQMYSMQEINTPSDMRCGAVPRATVGRGASAR